jgi:YVTN family beta-propeller protein
MKLTRILSAGVRPAYVPFVLAIMLCLSSPPAEAIPKNQIVGTVVVGSQALGLVVSPDSRFVYVADFLSSTITVIDTSINQVTATIPGVARAEFLAISPDGQTLYASGSKRSPTEHAEVTVISTSTNTVTKRIKLGSQENEVTSLAMRPGGTELWASTDTGIFIIDTSNDQISSKIALGSQTDEIVFTQHGRWAYASYTTGTSSIAAYIALIRSSTRRVVISKMAQRNLPAPKQTGFFGSISLNPNDLRLYVMDNQSNSLNSIEAIDLLNNRTVNSIYSAPHGTFIIGESVTPDGQYLYVLGETPDTVVTVALGSNTVVGQPVPVGFGGRIAIAPDGKYAYVSGRSSPTGGNGQVTIIDITPQ